MTIKPFCSLLCSLFLGTASAQAALAPLQNQLKDHPSPYLALHAEDPTAWQDWSADVLERAKAENKLIFISSGYFSCHWCHVMQRESYQSPEVAELLNRHFIPVKIDRELEPALDARLMDYAQSSLKRGGWPLNVFVSPDGLEVFALLYQPQAQFKQLLGKIIDIWGDQSKRISDLAKQESTLSEFPAALPELDAEKIKPLLAVLSQQLLARVDDFEGGFKGSNKFPSSPQLSFLLHQYQRSPDDTLREALTTTLDAMAFNGLTDHLQGGFYRYTVDPGWAVPHFEKMLYNNANLSRLYLDAADILAKPEYAEVARITLNFMLAEMRDPSEKAFYAAFSAVDDHDVEGGYYLWDSEQIRHLLSEDEFPVFDAVWDMGRTPDLEEGNHLRAPRSSKEVASQLKLELDEVESKLSSARAKLISARKRRVLPVDDKLLAGWNSLALSSLIKAAKQFNHRGYAEAAEQLQRFISTRLWDGEGLARGLADGKLVGRASLEDYAYFAEAQWLWAQFSEKAEDLDLLKSVITVAWQKFYQNNAWLNTDESLLPARSGVEVVQDGALPAPAPVLIRATLGYAAMSGDKSWHDTALSALNRGYATLPRSAYWYASHAQVMAEAISGKAE